MENVTINKNKAYVVAAIVLPLFFSWLFVQVQFWVGASIANPTGALFAVVSGIYIATKIEFPQNKFKILFWVAYLVLLILSALFIGLLTSCANGDCI
jgi:hypothetical protein